MITTFVYNKKNLTKNTGQQETQSWLKSLKHLKKANRKILAMRNQTPTFGPCRIAACEEEGPSLTHHLPTSSVVQFVCTLSKKMGIVGTGKDRAT
jgi:hypothetical protein